jgi:hypothetical protein
VIIFTGYLCWNLTCVFTFISEEQNATVAPAPSTVRAFGFLNVDVTTTSTSQAPAAPVSSFSFLNFEFAPKVEETKAEAAITPAPASAISGFSFVKENHGGGSFATSSSQKMKDGRS